MEENRDDPPERVPWFTPWRWGENEQWELAGWFFIAACLTWLAWIGCMIYFGGDPNDIQFRYPWSR